MRRGAAFAAVVLVAMAAVAGCGDAATGTGTPSRSSGSAPEVSDAVLAPGVYRSQQSATMPPATEPLAWRRLQAVRLAESLVFPREVDADLAVSMSPTQPLASADDVEDVIAGTASLPVMEQFEYGYAVAAGGGDDEFAHAVLTFDSAETARRAAADIAAAALAGDGESAGAVSTTIAGTPTGTRAILDTSGGSAIAVGVTPVGRTVMYSWVLTDEQRRAEDVVRKALTRQLALLTPTPVISGDREPDPTGLIRGTVASDDGAVREVYAARGAALQFDDQPGAHAAMTRAGVTEVARARTTAFRAGDGDRASGLADYLLRAYSERFAEATEAASPPGLSAARCRSADLQSVCVIVVGRYVGEANAPTLREAQQLVSAQSGFLATL